MPTFEYQELLPYGHHDDTPFRKLTSDHVASWNAHGKSFLEVQPEALTLLAKTAMRDIAHLLRSAHLPRVHAKSAVPPLPHARKPEAKPHS